MNASDPLARRPRSWPLLLAVLPLAALAGMVAALGSPPLLILVLAIVLAPWLLLMPMTGLLSLLIFLAVLGAGCLQYFAKVHQAHWLPTLLLVLLALRIPLDALRTQRSSGQAAPRLSLLGGLLIGFVALVGVSAVLNLVQPMQLLVGLRHYVFPLALVVAVLQTQAGTAFFSRLLRWLPWLMLIQLPLCAYQYFFVAQGRVQTAFGGVGIGWDAVVGSFGGNPEGGGASGALALFLALGVAGSLLLQQAGQISRRLAWASHAAVAGCALFAEIKVLIVFLPLALLILQRRQLLRSPLAALVWAGSTAVLGFALLQAYNLMHYGQGDGRSVSAEESVEMMMKAERDPRFYNPLTGEVSRIGALLLWSDDNLARRFGMQALIGHGPAASKVSSLFGVGSAVKGKRYTLTTSTASQMLWDLGLSGLLLFAGTLGLALREALRQAQLHRQEPERWALAEFAALGLGLSLIGLFYNGDAINNPAVQVLLSLCLGLVLVLRRQRA